MRISIAVMCRKLCPQDIYQSCPGSREHLCVHLSNRKTCNLMQERRTLKWLTTLGSKHSAIVYWCGHYSPAVSADANKITNTSNNNQPEMYVHCTNCTCIFLRSLHRCAALPATKISKHQCQMRFSLAFSVVFVTIKSNACSVISNRIYFLMKWKQKLFPQCARKELF